MNNQTKPDSQKSDECDRWGAPFCVCDKCSERRKPVDGNAEPDSTTGSKSNLLASIDPIEQMRTVVLAARESDSMISRQWVSGWADAWERERAANRPVEAEGRESALPMDSAPRDGTIVRLLVQFTDGGFEDVGPEKATWTIGQNGADHHPEDDEWLFAGWNWEQDCFTQGEGTPIGWLPMIGSPPPEQPAIDLEMFRPALLFWRATRLAQSVLQPSGAEDVLKADRLLAIIDGAKGGQ